MYPKGSSSSIKYSSKSGRDVNTTWLIQTYGVLSRDVMMPYCCTSNNRMLLTLPLRPPCYLSFILSCVGTEVQGVLMQPLAPLPPPISPWVEKVRLERTYSADKM